MSEGSLAILASSSKRTPAWACSRRRASVQNTCTSQSRRKVGAWRHPTTPAGQHAVPGHYCCYTQPPHAAHAEGQAEAACAVHSGHREAGRTRVAAAVPPVNPSRRRRTHGPTYPTCPATCTATHSLALLRAVPQTCCPRMDAIQGSDPTTSQRSFPQPSHRTYGHVVMGHFPEGK